MNPVPSMLNIGANKGYDVRSFIERFDARWTVSSRSWAQSLARHNVTDQVCGACGACGERPRWRAFDANAGAVVAVEAEPQNARLLSKLFAEHAMRGRDVRVLQAVVTGPFASAASFVPIMREIGSETTRPVEKAEIRKGSRKQFSRVRTTTIDDIIASQALQRVDLCLIDTEGMEHAVLRGAEGALRAQLLKVVAFEYSGLWCFRQPNNACIRLEPVISFLASFAYSCWWLGNDGSVARIDPACEDASTRRWSNVGCVADPGLVAKMEKLERSRKHAPEVTNK